MTIETVTILLYIWLSVSLVFPLLAVILLRRGRRMKAELAATMKKCYMPPKTAI